MGKRKMGPLVCVDVKTILALLYYKNLAHVCTLGEQKQQTDSPPSVLLFHTGFSSFTSSSSNLSDSTWSQSWLHLRAVCKKRFDRIPIATFFLVYRDAICSQWCRTCCTLQSVNEISAEQAISFRELQVFRTIRKFQKTERSHESLTCASRSRTNC